MAKASDQSKTGFVTVATVRSRGEAQTIAAKLKAAGIESLLSVERTAQFPPPGSHWFGGTKVQVSRSDVEAALRALHRSPVASAAWAEVDRDSVGAAARSRSTLDSWRGAAAAVLGMIAVASLLALWLF
jgi:hypothetical protein